MNGSKYPSLKKQLHVTSIEIRVKGLREEKKRKEEGIEGHQLNKKHKRGHITPFSAVALPLL